MSDSDFELNRHLDNEDLGSNSDSSVGIKDFGADVSELSDNDNINTSGEDMDEDELVNKLEHNVLLKKNDDSPVFVDEFGSEDEDMMSDNIDDINKNNNKIKIFKTGRTIYHNGRFYKKPPRYNFLSEMMNKMLEEGNIKNVAFIGPYKSGKTTLVSNILMKQHRKHFQRQKYDIVNKKKYLDNSLITKYRKTTCRMNMGSFLHNNKDVVNVIDTPGHADLWNETYMACDMADFVYIVIDAVEGVTDSVVRLYKMVTSRLGKKVAFIINKIDRLVLEVKLDVVNFYFKLISIVNQLNMMKTDNSTYSPELGNVLFASSKLHFMFSIEKFLKITNKQCKSDEKTLNYMTARCWGNVIFKNNKFLASNDLAENYEYLTFVQFIAKPLYKILLNGLTYNVKDLKAWVKLNFDKELMSSAEFEDIHDQLMKLCECIFEVDRRNPEFKKQEEVLLKNLEDVKTDHSTTEVKVKAYKTIDYNHDIWCLCKVTSGLIQVGTTLKYRGETLIVAEMALMGGRYTRSITSAYPNQVILIKRDMNIDNVLNYPFNEVLTEGTNEINESPHSEIFSEYINEAVVKVGLQSKSPKHYDLLRKALDLIKSIYPDISIDENETSKMFFLHASGELKLDILLFELRYFYMCYYDRDITDFIEIKSTANLITNFREGCSIESFASIPVPSKEFNVSVVATPLSDDLSKAISEKTFNPSKLLVEGNLSELSSTLRKTYNWESGMARNVLSINDTVFLVNDILPEDLETELFEKVKSVIVEAFEEVIENGPLAEERIHNTIFKLMSLEKIEDEESQENLALLKESLKNAFKIALLSGKPILYEPYYEFSIITNTEFARNIEYALRKRRGCQIRDIRDIPGSKLIEIEGTVPCIDSSGLNVDLLLVSNGSCIYQTNTMSRMWHRVEGDVMDSNIELSKIEPAKGSALGRDFLMKTRKRKDIESTVSSMNDVGPSLEEYIDRDLYLQLKEMNLI